MRLSLCSFACARGCIEQDAVSKYREPHLAGFVKLYVGIMICLESVAFGMTLESSLYVAQYHT